MQKIMFNDRFGLTQAVIEGRKTMTRRIIKIDNDELRGMQFRGINEDGLAIMRSSIGVAQLVPKYKIGEVVAVAQAYGSDDFCKHIPILHGVKIETEAEGALIGNYNALKGWDNKMFVRADLMLYKIKITNIRVECLQDISEEDCMKEGIKTDGYNQKYYTATHFNSHYNSPQEAFSILIDKVSGKGTWNANPYVFVYEFELVK